MLPICREWLSGLSRLCRLWAYRLSEMSVILDVDVDFDLAQNYCALHRLFACSLGLFRDKSSWGKGGGGGYQGF